MQLMIILIVFIALNAAILVSAGSTGGEDCRPTYTRKPDPCWEKCQDPSSQTSTKFPECMSECKASLVNYKVSCEGCPMSEDCCSRCEVDFLSCGVVCAKGGFNAENTAKCLSGCKGLLIHSCIAPCGGCSDRFGESSTACHTTFILCEILRSRSIGLPCADLYSGCTSGRVW